MNKSINKVKIQYPKDREALIEAATRESDTCVSVGGLADNFGMMQAPPIPVSNPAIGPKVFARLVEFWRRKQRLTIKQLAEKTGLDEAEVFDAEQGDTVPELRVLHTLSQALGVSYDKLLHLTGHVQDRNEQLKHAAVRFAANSESMEQLSKEEETALHDFIRELAE